MRVPDSPQEARDVLRLLQVAREQTRVAGLGAAEDILRRLLVVATRPETAVFLMMQQHEEIHAAARDVEAAKLLRATDDPCIRIGVAVVVSLTAQRPGEVAVFREYVLRDPRR